MGKAKLFLGCGEVLWDLLPGGRQLGGAPINAAVHARALGAEAHPISRVGDDSLGVEIVKSLRAANLPTQDITVDPEAPTGTVSVEVVGGQPKYTIHENVAWDRMTADESALALAQRADAICFGTLAQRGEMTRACIYALIQAVPTHALRIFDVNLRQRFFSLAVLEKSLRLANVVKLNDLELLVLSELFKWGGSEESQLATLVLEYDLKVAALTRGAKGSALFYADGNLDVHPGIKAKVTDAVGAGDAFTAALSMGLLLGWDAAKINQHANEIAAYVVTQNGATPPLPESLVSDFRQ